MFAHRLFAVSCLAVALFGCGNDNDTSREEETSRPALVEDVNAPLDKARAVEDTTMQHKEELDRALDESSH